MARRGHGSSSPGGHSAARRSKRSTTNSTNNRSMSVRWRLLRLLWWYCRWWWWFGNHGWRSNALEKGGSQVGRQSLRQVRSAGRRIRRRGYGNGMLRQLHESHRHGKFARIERIGNGLVARRPNVLELRNGQFGARQKGYGLRTANGSGSIHIGRLKQSPIIGLTTTTATTVIFVQ
jgi:hypothetical protein